MIMGIMVGNLLMFNDWLGGSSRKMASDSDRAPLQKTPVMSSDHQGLKMIEVFASGIVGVFWKTMFLDHGEALATAMIIHHLTIL